MSKGQKRSSKEIRKPKQVKAAAVADAPTAGSQVRQAPPSLPTGRAGSKR
jgi:hypothetical protein